MTIKEKIIEGFNAGYLMEKHEPELSKSLREGIPNPKDPYILGFLKGAQQCQKERNKEMDSLFDQLDLDGSLEVLDF